MPDPPLPDRSPAAPEVRALAGRVEARRDALARQMVARLRAGVPFYAHLPREQLDGDILTICRLSAQHRRVRAAPRDRFPPDRIRSRRHPGQCRPTGRGAGAPRRRPQRVPRGPPDDVGALPGRGGPDGAGTPAVGGDGTEEPGGRVPELIGELAAAARSPIVAGYAWHPGVAGVVRSGTEARQLAELAVRLDRPPGAYRLDDLVLEYALSRDPAAMDRLAAVLAPLETQGTDLVESLEVYVRCQLDRRRAAAALHVHPNTLDYRMKRVRAFTGLDMSTASGITMIGAGLLARRIARGARERG
ncbi:MAG: helix-turn-helix domain-containing protein [Actinomycetota bacterium]|nr:helix-turn-helix domain-containing protein [Actinomycetota bacterium]